MSAWGHRENSKEAALNRDVLSGTHFPAPRLSRWGANSPATELGWLLHCHGLLLPHSLQVDPLGHPPTQAGFGVAAAQLGSDRTEGRQHPLGASGAPGAKIEATAASTCAGVCCKGEKAGRWHVRGGRCLC